MERRSAGALLSHLRGGSEFRLAPRFFQNLARAFQRAPPCRAPDNVLRRRSQSPLIPETPHRCNIRGILHIDFPWSAAPREPFYLICAAEVNSALRQGFSKTLYAPFGAPRRAGPRTMCFAAGHSPHLYPKPHTVVIYVGFCTLSSIFSRRRRMFTSTIFSSPK